MTSKMTKLSKIIKPLITVLILVFVGIAMLVGAQEPSITVSGDYVEISGMYGVKFNISDIENVTLIEQSMESIGVGSRTNGYGGIGKTLKGHFGGSGGRSYMLFVYSSSVPTILLERDGDKDIYISVKDGEKTREIYDLLATAVRGYE